MANERARSLRKNLTDAERKLWLAVRRGQLNNHNFRRQHPIGPYIVDFICLERKLIIELDGDQHGHDAQKTHDEKRDHWLENRGYRVVRYWNNDIYSNLYRVVEEIAEYLNVPRDTAPPP